MEGKTVFLDCLREMRPPFAPSAVVENFVQVLRAYQCWTVRGDRWAGEWVREPLLTHGVSYELSELSKSEIYQAFMPMMNSGTVALLDNDRLERQLVALERKVSRGGRDSIDHPPGGHDDLANVAAGACLIALERGEAIPVHRLPTHGLGATHDPLASPEENALALASEEARFGYFTGPGCAPTWHGDDESLPVRAIN
jgi:hypothetical protein